MALRIALLLEHTPGQGTPPRKREAAVESAFAQMVHSLVTLNNAERDIVGLPSGDVAFDSWFRDAESARAAVLKSLDAVIMCHPTTATDHRFRVVARCFEAMLLTHDAAEYAATADAMMQQAGFDHFLGHGVRAARVSALLRAFGHHFSVLLSFPDYTPPSTLGSPSETLVMAA